MECIGRKDGQIKLRGYRIELGEIENILNTYEFVQQSVVLLLEKQLVAYYVPVHETEVLESNLLEFIKGKLPDYMVPRLFVSIPSLPLTVNGKVDKGALPHPEPRVDSVVLPRNEVEEEICRVWKETLGLDGE